VPDVRIRADAVTAERPVSRPLRRADVLAAYRRIVAIERLQPHSREPLDVAGLRVSFASLYFLRWMYRSIFVREDYRWRRSAATPTVIDAGANSGLATLYFKAVCPGARIICFEPDPEAIRLLRANVQANALADVEIHDVALSADGGALRLYHDPHVAADPAQSVSRAFLEAQRERREGTARSFPAERLEPWLRGPVDLLKLDTEGSEGPVLASVHHRLDNVRELRVEYHGLEGGHRLRDLLDVIAAAGMTYEVMVSYGVPDALGGRAMIHAFRP
jgi:FkbM family methyltransferase